MLSCSSFLNELTLLKHDHFYIYICVASYQLDSLTKSVSAVSWNQFAVDELHTGSSEI